MTLLPIREHVLPMFLLELGQNFHGINTKIDYNGTGVGSREPTEVAKHLGHLPSLGGPRGILLPFMTHRGILILGLVGSHINVLVRVVSTATAAATGRTPIVPSASRRSTSSRYITSTLHFLPYIFQTYNWGHWWTTYRSSGATLASLCQSGPCGSRCFAWSTLRDLDLRVDCQLADSSGQAAYYTPAPSSDFLCRFGSCALTHWGTARWRFILVRGEGARFTRCRSNTCRRQAGGLIASGVRRSREDLFSEIDAENEELHDIPVFETEPVHTILAELLRDSLPEFLTHPSGNRVGVFRGGLKT